MPLTTHHVWHIKIRPSGPGSVMAEIHKFRGGGFKVIELPDVSRLRYSLHHSSASAMILHMLREDCTNLTIEEF